MSDSQLEEEVELEVEGPVWAPTTSSFGFWWVWRVQAPKVRNDILGGLLLRGSSPNMVGGPFMPTLVRRYFPHGDGDRFDIATTSNHVHMTSYEGSAAADTAL